jgi:hypothetical protein
MISKVPLYIQPLRGTLHPSAVSFRAQPSEIVKITYPRTAMGNKNASIADIRKSRLASPSMAAALL